MDSDQNLCTRGDCAASLSLDRRLSRHWRRKALRTITPVKSASIQERWPDRRRRESARGRGFAGLIRIVGRKLCLRLRRIEQTVTLGVPIAAVCCERTRLQLRPYLHWCVCPKRKHGPRQAIEHWRGSWSTPLGQNPSTGQPGLSCSERRRRCRTATSARVTLAVRNRSQGYR